MQRPLRVPKATLPGVLPADLHVGTLSVAACAWTQGVVVQQPCSKSDLGVGVGAALVGNARLELPGVGLGAGEPVVLGVGIEHPTLLSLAGQAGPAERGCTAVVMTAQPGLAPA